MDRSNLKIFLVGGKTPALDFCADTLNKCGISFMMEKPHTLILNEIIPFKPHLVLAEISEEGSCTQWIFPELVKETRAPIPTIFMGEEEILKQIPQAIKNKAVDFLIWPFDTRTLFLQFEKALESFKLLEDIKDLQSELQIRQIQDSLKGTGPKIQGVLERLIKVASTNANVLITGETGTGKELIARAVHYNSPRAGKPFITLNCSTLPRDLFESMLFGHIKGSYTGAGQTVKGIYGEADKGSLFLDEIAEFPLRLQAKLLRVVEGGGYQKVGGSQTLHADVRILSATNKDLQGEIDQKRFREDLFHRLNTFPIHVPPLRERKEDIPEIANYFFRKFQSEINNELKGFSASAIQKLLLYSWPGNIRELENKVQRAMVDAKGPTIYREDIIFDELRGGDQLKSFKEAKTEFEKNYVMNVLSISNGNVSQAARLAKKDRKDFYGLMGKYGFQSSDFRTR